ncbi:hypothetical protein O1611_g10130 [Lasiodiplodia mahajangana]|uniref:Uncharacterized protein n=1 Tax=Lasiodiplodia mahajangana TaxID=1108764 RepID=A0ACC2J1L0_9PEZI|nr:hypothetical protein O1611_g10130 [Lasiodiplodia mahajangana]
MPKSSDSLLCLGKVEGAALSREVDVLATDRSVPPDPDHNSLAPRIDPNQAVLDSQTPYISERGGAHDNCFSRISSSMAITADVDGYLQEETCRFQVFSRYRVLRVLPVESRSGRSRDETIVNDLCNMTVVGDMVPFRFGYRLKSGISPNHLGPRRSHITTNSTSGMIAFRAGVI